MASPVSPYMMSSGDSVENLSPDRALQKVRELVTNSLDTLSKVGSTALTNLGLNGVVQHWAAIFLINQCSNSMVSDKTNSI